VFPLVKKFSLGINNRTFPSRSRMRSLTQSSADTPSHFLPDPPVNYTQPILLHAVVPHTHVTPRRHTTRIPSPRNVSSSPLASRFLFNVADSATLLSPQSRGHVAEAIQGSWASSTLKRYSGAVDQFTRFCDKEGIPGHLRFPADEFVLCAFAASSVRKHSKNTPRNRLSALKAWHVVHNMEWKGSARLRYVLNGVHNLAPGSSRRPPRPPVNANMISQLIQRLNLNSPVDIAVAACAATAFWGQCRLGELLPANRSPSSIDLLPIRAGFKRSLRNPHSCVLHLPRTKTHAHGQEVVLVDQHATIDPISLLKRHLRLNNIPGNAHIFSFATDEGLTPLTKSSFLRRCNSIWHPLGYPRTTGHCFRIGGTTELLVAGTPPDVVKAMGRWSSDSFLRYWRTLDDIAPQHVRHLHSVTRKRRHH